MIKVQVSTVCRACGGQAYLPFAEETTADGRRYMRHLPCTACRGTGRQAHWLHLHEFVSLLLAVQAEEKKA